VLDTPERELSILDKWPLRGVALLAYVVAGAAYIEGCLPIALWFSAFVGACHSRAVVGYWPMGSATFGAYKIVVPGGLEDWAFFLSLAALSIGSATLIHRVVRPRWTWVVGTPMVVGLGWSAFFVLMWLDPGGILGWWMD
jgi:hypothetical protein